MGMILHTIVIHDTGVVVAGGICPIRTCLVLNNCNKIVVNLDRAGYCGPKNVLRYIAI